MSRDESAVATTLQDSVRAEADRRREQIVLLHPRQSEFEPAELAAPGEAVRLAREVGQGGPIRVAVLEGRVRLLTALLVTALVGTVAIFAAVVHPESSRRQAAFLNLTQASERRAREQESERRELERQLTSADARMAALTEKLGRAERALSEAMRRSAPSAPPRRPGSGPITSGRAPTACHCDPNDPLCPC